MAEHGTEASTSTSSASSSTPTSSEEPGNINKHNYVLLCNAALDGDYEMAKTIFNSQPEILKEKILSITDETTLHVAAGANQTNFVKEVLRNLSDSTLRVDLTTEKDYNGKTVFYTAIAAGASDIVNILLNMENFMNTQQNDQLHPLSYAALFGHEKIASMLYDCVKERTIISPSDDQLNEIILNCTHSDLYALALKILDDNILVLAEDRDYNIGEETALHVLSRKSPSVFASTPEQNGPWWKISSRFRRPSSVPIETPALKLAKELWKRVLKAKGYDFFKIKEIIDQPFSLLTEAAKVGNYDFLVVLIEAYPELNWKKYEEKTIFHIAIENRHVEIFKLIHEIGLPRTCLQSYQDEEGNNLLHLVARKPPKNRLGRIVGAALQMREELLWYQEVEKIVFPSFRNKMNDAGETPKDLFTEQHASLMTESEKWMKKNSNIGLLVATIILTVIFQAAFAPVADQKNESLSIILIISNAIAMSTSSIAIMLFMSIIISRFTENELFWSLPFTFIAGVGSLFLSVIFMMVSFCLATFVANKSLAIRICTCFLQALPIPLFVYLVYPTLHDLIKSIFYSKRAFIPKKRALQCIDQQNTDLRLAIDDVQRAQTVEHLET